MTMTPGVTIDAGPVLIVDTLRPTPPPPNGQSPIDPISVSEKYVRVVSTQGPLPVPNGDHVQ
jgi:hypothetical protein